MENLYIHIERRTEHADGKLDRTYKEKASQQGRETTKNANATGVLYDGILVRYFNSVNIGER